jgi:hypothetical protein
LVKNWKKQNQGLGLFFFGGGGGGKLLQRGNTKRHFLREIKINGIKEN